MSSLPPLDNAVPRSLSTVTGRLQSMEIRDGTQFSPLISAAKDGDVETLKSLLLDPVMRATINTSKDIKGQTALHHALNGACVQILCKFGADIFTQDALGNTPLHAATERHCSGAVREILSFAESSTVDAANFRCVNVQNMMGETALHIAVKGQNKPICTLICSYKPDYSLVNHFGQTVLHLAAKEDDLDLVEMLVREGANPNVHDELGMTALHIAVLNEKQDINICRVLIENGADVGAVDKNGRKPVDLANEHKYEQKAHYLESQGGNIIPLYFARKAEGNETNWVPLYATTDNSGSGKKTKTFDLDLSGGDERSFDRWGFEIPPDANPESYAIKESDLKVEIRRTGKWKTMTASKEVWEKWIKRNYAKVRERCCKGIPPKVRGRAWVLLSGADRTRAKYEPDFYKSLLCEPTPSLAQIDMDIHRTYRSHELFRTRYGNGQRMLFNVLRAYSVYDKDVGYCQGMAEITAILLMFMPEEDAFWVLVQLLAAPKYALREMYLPGFSALHTHFHVHSRLVQQMIPKLHVHFEDVGMKTVFYATKWYSTLFNSVLPFEHTVRVWDVVMIEGTEILYTVAVRILEAYQRKYLEMDFAALMPSLLTLKDIVTETPNEFITIVTHRPVLHSVIDALRLEYAKEQFRSNHDDTNIPNPKPVSPHSFMNVALQHTSSDDMAQSLLSRSQPEQTKSQPHFQRPRGSVTPKTESEHCGELGFLNLNIKRRERRPSECSRVPANTPENSNQLSPPPLIVQPDPKCSAPSSLVIFSPAPRSRPIPISLSPPPDRSDRTPPVRHSRMSRSQTQMPVFHETPPSGIPVEAESILGSGNSSLQKENHE